MYLASLFQLAGMMAVLFFVLGPKERYFFIFLVICMLLLSAVSKTVILKIQKAEKVEDPIILELYDLVCRRFKILWIFPMVGPFQPPLYRSKMDCPNAFACGLNLFWLAKLPLVGSAIVVSDELLELFGNSQGQIGAIIGHELGHIESFDVFLMSFLGIVHSMLSLAIKSRSILLRSSYILLWLIFLPWQLITLACLGNISQIRECSADLSAVLAFNDTTQLISALTRLSEFKQVGNKSYFQKLLMSHPEITTRIDYLKGL
jgi:Zn-dependent protease with chaperone function